MIPLIYGRKKGAGGGRSPRETPDNLLSDATARILDAISEGEIEGWADPDNTAKCIYFDDTPLQNEDGSYNFEGVEFELRTGTPDQDPIEGFSAVESETQVGVLVENGTPVARTITNTEPNAARITVVVPQLNLLDTSTGDLKPFKVAFNIEMQVGSGGWTRVGPTRQIRGKTTSGYQRAYRVRLPEERPVSLRIVRITPDPPTSNKQNEIYFGSLTEIIDARLSYPGTALVGLALPADAFGGRIPRRSYRIKGIRGLIPSNYDPVGRTYTSAIWDGSFVRSWHQNPAWALYEELIEDRWGLGERIDPSIIDKWAFYEIGRYCDEMVPDGKDGMEPRFSINGALTTREKAFEVVRQLSSVFRGVTYWGAGAIVPVQDAPADPVKLVTNANVEDGVFAYSGTPRAGRHTAAVVSCRDPEDLHRMRVAVAYDDPDQVARLGRREAQIALPFCSSDGEGLRTAKWLVDTDTVAGESVVYQAGFDHAGIRPFDIVAISDKHRVGHRLGGRVRSIDGPRVLTIDDPIDSATGVTKIRLATRTGGWIDMSLDPSTFAGGGSVSSLITATDIPATIIAGRPWAAHSDVTPIRRFRVLSNAYEDGVFTVSAVELDPFKWARVELGINIESAAPYILPPVGIPAAPTGLTIREWASANPGGRSTPMATLSWLSSGDPRVSQWRVAMREPEGVWTAPRTVFSPSADFQLSSGLTAGYSFRAQAITATGLASPWSTINLDPDGVTGAPPPPTGLTVTGGVARNVISWTLPDVPDLAYIEVLAAQEPNSAVATVIGRTASSEFPHEALGLNQEWWYWVRTVTHAEVDNVSALAGPVTIITSGVISPLFEEKSVLLEHLSTPILTKIDEDITTAVTASQTVLQAADQALASSINGVSAALQGVESDVNANAAAITQEVTARVSAVSAVAQSVTTVEAQIGAELNQVELELVAQAGETGLLEDRVDDFEAAAFLRVGAGGKIAGFAVGISGGLSHFDVLSDRFRVSLPNGSGTKTVFVVGSINGSSQVGIRGDILIDGTIVGRHLAANSVTADKINVDTLEAINISVRNLDIDGQAVTTDKIATDAVTVSEFAVKGDNQRIGDFGANTWADYLVDNIRPGVSAQLHVWVTFRLFFLTGSGRSDRHRWRARLTVNSVPLAGSGIAGDSDGENLNIYSAIGVGASNQVVRLQVQCEEDVEVDFANLGTLATQR